MKLFNSSIVIKYATGGLFTVAVEYGLFALLLALSAPLLAANTISFIVALMTSFMINRYLVFDEGKLYGKSGQKQLGLYAVLSVVNLLVSNVLVYFLSIAMVPLLAKLLAMAIIAGYNFLIYRLGIFKPVAPN